MKYAVIRFGGKQFMVEEGDKIELTRQPDSSGVEVLYCVDGNAVQIGTPIVSQFKVVLTKIEDKLGDKVRVARFKSKSRYRKVKGHRQPLSIFEVKSIKKGVAKKTTSKREVKKVTTEAKKPTRRVKTVAKASAKTPKKPKKVEQEAKN